MNIYLLWFNEWEANYVLGVFETKEQAEKWKSYFIDNPLEDSWIAPDMKYFSEKDPDTWIGRFKIEERVLGQLDPDIKIDNLKYVEHLFTENEKKPE